MLRRSGRGTAGTDAVWPGVVPGARLVSHHEFASSGTGGPGINDDAGSHVGTNSGPSIWEAPQVIHPPKSPIGHTDELFSLHPAGGDEPM